MPNITCDGCQFAYRDLLKQLMADKGKFLQFMSSHPPSETQISDFNGTVAELSHSEKVNIHAVLDNLFYDAQTKYGQNCSGSVACLYKLVDNFLK
jgi:hypothetical protein